MDFLSWFVPFKINAINLLAVIFVRQDVSEETLNEEKIHSAQYWELLIVGFVILYVASFITNYILFWDWHKAYRNIVFEIECHENMDNLNYLETRKEFAWVDYLYFEVE